MLELDLTLKHREDGKAVIKSKGWRTFWKHELPLSKASFDARLDLLKGYWVRFKELNAIVDAENYQGRFREQALETHHFLLEEAQRAVDSSYRQFVRVYSNFVTSSK